MLSLLLAIALGITAQSDPVSYPTGFRKWAHVKTVVVGPKSESFASSGGIHHIYANEKGMEGYRTGKFPDGSILVFDLLQGDETQGVTTEGKRTRLDVMQKASGNWQYERFLGDSTTRALTPEVRTVCVTCHDKRKAQDF